MNHLYIFCQLDPVRAIRDDLRTSNYEATIAIAGTWLVSWLGEVNWGAILAVIALAATTIGGTALQLWKQWRIVKLELKARERELRQRSPEGGERRWPRHV
jgi:hypothetical protein